MSGFDNGVVFASNVDFSGSDPVTGKMQTNGQLLIGTTALNAGGTHINVGTIVGGAGVTVGYSSPNITISLSGGGASIDSVAVQTGAFLTVVPDAAGLLTINGAVVAAGTNPVRTDGTGANTLAIEVQTSQALAAADATKIGLANFDSASFAVAATGFVTLSTTGAGKTITGDTGGALSPTSNNWNILGGPGVTTTGSGSTLTINSVVYTDQGSNTSVLADSGSFATAAITLTLPAVPVQGELCEFVVTGANALVVKAAGTQLLQIYSAASTAGGTATSTAVKGSSLVLRYRASDTTWYATQISGIWLTA